MKLNITKYRPGVSYILFWFMLLYSKELIHNQ